MEPREQEECDTITRHADGPCRVCGELLALRDLPTLYLVGPSRCGRSRAAHGKCFEAHAPRETWAFPHDEGK